MSDKNIIIFLKAPIDARGIAIDINIRAGYILQIFQ